MTHDPIDVLISSGERSTDAYLFRTIAEQVEGYRINTAGSEEELRRRLPYAKVLLAWGLPVDALRLATRLEWLQVIGAGVDNLMPAKDVLRGVTVTNIRGVFGRPIAEYVIAYALAHFQRIRHVLAQQRHHAWTQFVPERLEGRTFGIVGLGSIGTEIARLTAALGARVIGLRRSAAPAPHVERVYAMEEVAEFLCRCDVLVLALPGTAETSGFMSLERLAMLKPTSFIINVGRGSALPAAHLVTALDRGLIAGAAIDVFEQEPLPSESPLWDRADVFITPHVSGINRPEGVAGPIVANLRRFIAGEPLINVVDLDRGY